MSDRCDGAKKGRPADAQWKSRRGVGWSPRRAPAHKGGFKCVGIHGLGPSLSLSLSTQAADAITSDDHWCNRQFFRVLASVPLFFAGGDAVLPSFTESAFPTRDRLLSQPNALPVLGQRHLV